MQRKIYQDLINWKNSANRKPLILQGARQVGKTYIANIFGEREYANTVYCNFEKEPSLRDFFVDLNPKRILEKIGNLKRQTIMPGATLVIFDEVQACPEALTSLKYFCEEASEYHIISAGSLLGVSTHRNEFSFPVGKVDFLNMHPMDFEEFLLACGNGSLVDEIKRCYIDDKALDRPLHEKALEFYRTYLYVGGMPEVVEEHLKSGNSNIVRSKQQAILDAYFADMGKYNSEPEIPKTRLIYKNISTQLAQENRKFKYAAVKKGGRASEFKKAREWLCMAGVANELHRIEQIKLPLNAYQSTSDFKFYMNDVGLCCASLNILPVDIMFDNPGLADFKGGLAENYVNNQLMANGFSRFYWTSGNQAEVDFIIRLGNDVIPIEVKSGDNTRARSLGVYMNKYKPKYCIRVSMRNFGFENNIKSVPLYAVFCVRQETTE